MYYYYYIPVMPWDWAVASRVCAESVASTDSCWGRRWRMGSTRPTSM